MQYANKSPVYTRYSRRVNTFARLESALRSDRLQSDALAVDHSLTQIAPIGGRSDLNSACHGSELWRFQKFVVHGRQDHMEWVATLNVYLAKGNVDFPTLVGKRTGGKRTQDFGCGKLFPMNV